MLNLFGLLPFTPPAFLAIGVLAILLGITMWAQFKLQPAAMDPAQQQVMALMPWMMMFVMAPFAAGLLIYWITSNLLTIAQQETGLQARRQQADGPARSLFQFELGGVKGVLEHPASSTLIQQMLTEMVYAGMSPAQVLAAMEFDQVLAATFARLALVRDPAPLPNRNQADAGWAYYVRIWDPGVPRPMTWWDNWQRAWATVG